MANNAGRQGAGGGNGNNANNNMNEHVEFTVKAEEDLYLTASSGGGSYAHFCFRLPLRHSVSPAAAIQSGLL